MANGPEAITIGANVGREVDCSQCAKKGKAEEFFSYEGENDNDVYLCKECRTSINSAIENETKDPNIAGAVGLGILASIIGGIAWYYITVTTEREIGYIAIGLGYLIGMAVMIGSKKKRGLKLQFLAAGLTLIAIFVSEYYIYTHFVNEYIQVNLNEFPDFSPGDVADISLFDVGFLKNLLSPIGLLIYAIGAYVAYGIPKAKKI